jgi:hypothetical protein
MQCYILDWILELKKDISETTGKIYNLYNLYKIHNLHSKYLVIGHVQSLGKIQTLGRSE